MAQSLKEVTEQIAFRLALKKQTIWYDEETRSYYRELPDGSLKRLTF